MKRELYEKKTAVAPPKVSEIRNMQINQTAIIGGLAKKMETFAVDKLTVVDGVTKKTTVAEEREVSVLGW